MATRIETDRPGPGKPAARRRMATRRSVLIADRLADWTITVGGIFVIVAVFAIMIFLAQVVTPLFLGGRVEAKIERTLAAGAPETLAATIDEHRTVVVKLAPDGRIDAYHLASGRKLAAPSFDFGGKTATAFERSFNWRHVAFGFADGTIRFGRLEIKTAVLPGDGAPAGLERLDERDRTDGAAIYSAIAGDQIRRTSIEPTLEPEQKISEAGRPIVAIDYRVGGTPERPTKTFVTADADGVVRLSVAETRTNIVTGQSRTAIRAATLPALPPGTGIAKAIVTDKGDMVLVADETGIVHRFDTRDLGAPKLAESVDVAPGGAKLTVLGFLLGEQSLVVGDSSGAVDVYFRLARPDAKTEDGFALVRAHRLEPHKSATAAFSPSQRGKMLVTADAGGEIWLRHSTSEQTLLKLSKPADSGPYRALLLAPREDGVLAVDDRGQATQWTVAAPHPETTLSSIFGKVWYEGYDGPGFTWQSSAGTDSFEPKLSLVPLIFGTIKATFYAMLFAAPLALLAAIYTSEFVHPSVRATVKPAMEMMASLPSVVLGFVAALILAPLVENWVMAVMALFACVPLGLILGAYLWQLLPLDLAIRWQGLPKFALMFAAVFASFYAASKLALAGEAALFGGDFKAWLQGDIGTGRPWMFLVLLPLAFAVVFFALRTAIGDWLTATARSIAGLRAGLFDFARGLAMFIAACLVSLSAAALLTALGYDPRGGFIGPYVQRNTLIVGFAMGFAVIPIVYTIAEDALNSVPEHLRAASLACGASPWQTATRIILPTAMSGVFAAVMIGMGRAVGETMIVVMAAGNTAIIDWNAFTGLRALSANIAVELPEAVKDGTLYRMLFLAALVLFVMTFAVNTAAELIRQRFRKRAVQL